MEKGQFNASDFNAFQKRGSLMSGIIKALKRRERKEAIQKQNREFAELSIREQQHYLRFRDARMNHKKAIRKARRFGGQILIGVYA